MGKCDRSLCRSVAGIRQISARPVGCFVNDGNLFIIRRPALQHDADVMDSFHCALIMFLCGAGAFLVESLCAAGFVVQAVRFLHVFRRLGSQLAAVTLTAKDGKPVLEL